VDLTKNFFQVFGLPPQYDLDMNQLMNAYRALQKQVHPDRFATAPDREKRYSMQWASYLNEGLETLKSPVRRAIYLLKLKGIEIDIHDNRVVDPMFLMEQMELREVLEKVEAEVNPYGKLDEIYAHLEQLQGDLAIAFKNDYVDGDTAKLEQATKTVAKMQFVEKLHEEANNAEQKLEG